MRVLFLGNHTVGVEALDAISARDEVVGVVAHPPDPEDGVRYLSVYEHALHNGWAAIRAGGKDPQLERFIKGQSPELLWITDYRYLVSPEIVSLTPCGAVNLHPSLLPRYRGRASINWAIINGEATLGLTAHFVDEGMDTGDIICQKRYQLRQEQDVGDALNILYPLYQEITEEVLHAFNAGDVPRRPQDHTLATVFAGRKEEDGLIYWNQKAISVWNLIRAVSHPYPGAFTFADNDKLLLWKAAPSPLPPQKNTVPGRILRIEEEGFHVQCNDAVLFVTSFELESGKTRMNVGTVLGK